MEAGRKAYLEDIRTVLRRYNAEGGAETQASVEFLNGNRQLDVVSENILVEIHQSAGKLPNRKELRALADVEGKIQTLAHMLSSSHTITPL